MGTARIVIETLLYLSVSAFLMYHGFIWYSFVALTIGFLMVFMPLILAPGKTDRRGASARKK